MQVFIPYSSPLSCAEVLDARRLNKQIIECGQILKAISGESSAWANHPCVLMYKKHKKWLDYYKKSLECYKSYKDLIGIDADEAEHDLALAEEWSDKAEKITPPFMTHTLCIQHRRRLYTKSPQMYPDFEIYGTSDQNWYYVNGEWLSYVNGKRINKTE